MSKWAKSNCLHAALGKWKLPVKSRIYENSYHKSKVSVSKDVEKLGLLGITKESK